VNKASLFKLMIIIPLTSLATEAHAFDKGFLAYMINDFTTALIEWRKKAELGNATAQTNIGDLYEAGNGVLKDNVLAYQWYSLGAMNGSNSAKKSKEYLETRMTPLEIKMAEELTKTCLASGYKDCSF
ncbi:MAG: hypothetical protein RI858_02495, partial [Planktomarina sp.]|nr:hypothetical protein [Planktomarina sp.]